MLLFYNKKTGELIQKMFRPPKNGIPADQLPPDWAAVEVSDDDTIEGKTHRVNAGKMERKPDAEIQAANDKEAWAELRQERNRRLAWSDKTQIGDFPGDRRAWAQYRKALRDLPKNTTDPRSPVWPRRPDE